MYIGLLIWLVKARWQYFISKAIIPQPDLAEGFVLFELDAARKIINLFSIVLLLVLKFHTKIQI